MEVQLVIKAPNQNIDDHVIHCNLDWTIQKLKNHLSEVYPNKPVIQEQKLIYSGRLLHDHLHLKDILRHEDGRSPPVHILHLVCNGSVTSQDQHSHSSHNSVNEATHSTATDLNDHVNESNPESSSENVLRNRNNPVMPSPSSLYSHFPPVNYTSAVSMLPSDPQILAQMAAMQQMYAYYFTQYMQSYHEGWFVRRPNPAVPEPEQRNRNNVDLDPNRGNNTEEVLHQNPSRNEELHDGHELEAAMDGDEPPHAQNPDIVNNNQIFSPLTFLAAFFSSLIPEPPPPVNIN